MLLSRNKILAITCSLFCLANIATSQDILSVPEEYLRPIVQESEAARFNYENEVLKPPKRSSGDRESWFVVSDRNQNRTYDKPNEASAKVKDLSFGDIAWVVEDRMGWLRLKGPYKLEDYGWIPKENVLQWRRGLLSKNGINLKGFLLNKANTFTKSQLEKAFLYAGPRSKDVIGELPLHEFYFVYKVTEERYLLADNSRLNTTSENKSKRLKGWVDKAKIEAWNTRMALEPNFTEVGFSERNGNEALHVKAYGNAAMAQKITESSGIRSSDNRVYWDSDPVKCDKALLASTNTRRFKGESIRFPILTSGDTYFKSGIIAQLPSDMAAQENGEIGRAAPIAMDPIREKYKKKAENLNLVFLIEGSEGNMKEYSQKIKELSTELSKDGRFVNIRFSAGVYKDILETNKTDYIKLLAPTTDISKLNAFIDKVYWGQNGDNEEYTCLDYGLYKTLQNANFKEEATNILVHLGSNTDLSAHGLRKKTAESTYLIEKNRIRDYFSKYEIHWICAKVNDNGSNASEGFADHIREYLVDLTKEIYFDLQKQVVDAEALNVKSLPEPFVPSLGTGALISTEKFITKNYFLRPDAGKELLLSSQVGSFISGSIQKIVDFNQKVYQKTKDPQSIDFSGSGRWTDEILPIIRTGLNQEAGRGLQVEEMEQEIENIQDVFFYKEVYFPKKQNTQINNPFSYVLFMPEEDLYDYTAEINRLIDAYNGPKDKRRESLQGVLEQLARKFAAQDVGLGQALNMEIEEIFQLMLGIQEEGFDIESKLGLGNYKIKDIDNPKKFPEAALETFARSMIRSTEDLTNIRKSKPPYEFQYTTDGNTYYWIPVELMY